MISNLLVNNGTSITADEFQNVVPYSFSFIGFWLGFVVALPDVYTPHPDP
jgi:hypothetical protein